MINYFLLDSRNNSNKHKKYNSKLALFLLFKGILKKKFHRVVSIQKYYLNLKTRSSNFICLTWNYNSQNYIFFSSIKS